ncbi:MAG: hypothetical protein O9264_00205 [Leptospira sp.]|jgi:hypothetical protein|nr:hypothetical protein [Leptospira sp.]
MNPIQRMSIFFLVFLSSLSLSAREVPSGGEMLLDIIIARPVGLAGAALGTAACVVATPFTLLSGTWEQTAKRLVIYPVRFTFVRGLGHFPGYMEEYETVED